MTQKNKNIKNIFKTLDVIKERLESYIKVDASLSDNTLEQSLFFLNLADATLESGFVKDSCDEVDNDFLVS